MRKKYSVLLIVFVFINVAGFTTMVSSASNDLPIPLTFEDTVEVTPAMLGEDEVAIRKKASEVGSALATGISPIGESAEVGDEFTFTVSDSGLNIDYDEQFVVVLEGEHGIILITKDAYDSFDGVYHFANPIGDDSEIWLRSEDLITPGQVTYLLDEFDNTIWPTVTTVYGEPLPRGDEGQKIWILLFNIRDEAYYNPDATSYVAGYFSASESAENNKNIMHIDTYDWIDRTGPDAPRPYLYEGTFSHEFEHLVHFDEDPDEPSWVDEGLADLSMFLCGYGHPSGHIAYYMVYHPYVSLTFWGNGLEDYGASYLFQLYLYEKFGGTGFVHALFNEPANGIEGIENTLKTLGYRHISFDQIFDAWTIANYLDYETKRFGMYGYETLEIGSIDTWGYSIEQVLTDNWWGSPDHITKDQPLPVSSDWFFGIEPQPYTAHYFRFTNDKLTQISIDGDDFAGTLPYSGSYEWYSDADAWAWRSFYQSFDIPAGGATLNFYTYFDIEDDWDYGYVEVFDHDTGEWYTLYAPGTVDYVAHDQNNPNCPDDREPSAYETAGRWHAFTGYSNGWMPVTMDLIPFSGHSIDLYFTTWQDGAFTLQMMWVDDISIPEIGFSDGAESGEGLWQSTGWYISDGMFDNGWDVTTIRVKDVPNIRYPDEPSTGKLLWQDNMWVCSYTQSGTMFIGATTPKSGHLSVAIVSNHADHILTSHYELMIEQFNWPHHCW